MGSKQKIAGIFAVGGLRMGTPACQQDGDLLVKFGIGEGGHPQRFPLDAPRAFGAEIRLLQSSPGSGLFLRTTRLLQALGGMGASLLLRLTAQAFLFGTFSAVRLQLQ